MTKYSNDEVFEEFMDYVGLTKLERDNMTPKWRKKWESTISYSYFVTSRNIEKIRENYNSIVLDFVSWI